MPPAKSIAASRTKGYLAVLITCTFAWTICYLYMFQMREFGIGLFIWLPFVMGVLCTMIHRWNNPGRNVDTVYYLLFALLIFYGGLILFAWDGVICALMTAPLALIFVLIGNAFANFLLKAPKNGQKTTIIIMLISVPCLMGFESRPKPDEKVRSVVTSMEIKASPEEVWKNVVAFSPLKEPTEFIFKTGIAYPISATIEGSGVGAIRHCNFSTGSFVEPITVWDEPRLLKFSVKEQPEPMKELSPYDIHPAHLQGYWLSREGQFKLTRLPNGNTLLEGTTWYSTRIKPGFYWNLWSDFIVHKIHKRVLEHIKQEAEREQPTAISRNDATSRGATNSHPSTPLRDRMRLAQLQ